MNAKQGTTLIVAQITEVLSALPEAVYSQPLAVFHGSSIGQHFRHILEFYTCLLEGIESGFVRYAHRRRDVRMSENPAAALETLGYVASAVAQLDEQAILQVEGEFSEAETDRSHPVYPSSIGRELQYAFDHAVHHLAIIRIGLEVCFPEIPFRDDLGVAPSTLKYRQQHPEAAPVSAG